MIGIFALLICLLVGTAEAYENEPVFFCVNGNCDKADEQRRNWRLDQFLDQQDICRQRMKEAMLEIDEILRINHESLKTRKPGEARITLNVSDSTFREWERVMQECVKGNPKLLPSGTPKP